MPSTLPRFDLDEKFDRMADAIERGYREVVERIRILAEGPSRGPITRQTRIRRLTETDIERALCEFEYAYEKSSGERLTSEAFYNRFCNGELDDRFAMRWAAYIEALSSIPSRAGTPARA